jgi:hypothetical protein
MRRLNKDVDADDSAIRVERGHEHLWCDRGLPFKLHRLYQFGECAPVAPYVTRWSCIA